MGKGELEGNFEDDECEFKEKYFCKNSIKIDKVEKQVTIFHRRICKSQPDFNKFYILYVCDTLLFPILKQITISSNPI